MDEIMRRANCYFLEFEGRHLYPKLLSWYWGIWLITTVAFGVSAYADFFRSSHVATRPWLASMFVFELLFLGACFAIGSYKTKMAMAGAPKGRSERGAFMDNKRRAVLEKICGIDSSKFAAAAKECSDLIATKKNFRVAADASFSEMLRNIYDPDSKARILALLICSTAAFVALMNHSVPAEDFNILEVWSDPTFVAWFKRLPSLTVALFGAWIGFRQLAGSGVELVRSFWAIGPGATHGSNMALNYFVRDLIRLHMPARTEEQVNHATPVATAAPADPTLPQPDLELERFIGTVCKGEDETRTVERV